MLIVGAGIAGPLLAMQLKDAGYRVVLYEARLDANPREGVFMGLTPNGLNVLKQFVPIQALETDYTKGAMSFFNSSGKKIGELPTDYQLDKYGAETIQIKRWHLNKLVQAATAERGIETTYGKKCARVVEDHRQATVYFDDGTNAEGDIVVGCDGAFSAVRKAMFPTHAKPAYTRLISTGGFARLPEIGTPSEGINMTFGERGFFAYAVSNNGEVWWFNNYFRDKEPAKEEGRAQLEQEIRTFLLDLHKNDDPLFSRIIKESHEIAAYPVYDIPKLKSWHTSRVCLIGDAAHATSPHVGQGASLAMEDTVCLVRCLRSYPDAQAAFRQFQQLRQARVEKIVKQARKVGEAKSKPGAVATWFRDRMLKFFLKAQIRQVDYIYGYKAG